MNGVRLSSTAELHRQDVTVANWDVSKKGAGGWDDCGWGVGDGGCSATGIYLTKYSCHACVRVYLCVCRESGKERKDYGNTSSLAHSNRGKTPQGSGL